MPPYKPFVPMKSHGIAVEDARRAETEEYARQIAAEAALERATGRISIWERLSRLLGRPSRSG